MLTAGELARRAGCSPARIAHLAELGILPAREEGFLPSDAQRVWLAEAFERSGITLADIARGIEAGRLSFANFDLYFPDGPGLSARTWDDLAAELGKSFETLRALARALGLPRPEPGRRLRQDDEETLRSLVAGWPVVSDGELLRVARLYGDGIRRIAESVVQLFQSTTTRRIVERDLPMKELEARVGAEVVRATAAGERLALALHRRHLEHYVIEESVARTEAALERAGLTPPAPQRPPAIAFLDLTGYTAVTEDVGDEAAAALAGSVADLVEETAGEHGGRAVKWLGDGVMFHFGHARGAVVSALELVARAAERGLPPARLGIDAGPVIFREGDYFGRTVNVAARIADYARPREVLVSEAVRLSAEEEGLRFEALGEIALKGVRDPIPLHRVARTL